MTKSVERDRFVLIVALLLIAKGGTLNNSYSLTKALERRFKTWAKGILEEVRGNKYADYDLINGVHHYRITSKGIELIKEEYNAALEFLLKEYPQESDILTGLFNSFSSGQVQG